MSNEAISRLQLVARLGSRDVAHDEVRDQLRQLLPQTSLAPVVATLQQLEARTRKVGLEAVRRTTFIPPLELAEPRPPRHPVRDEDLELAAQLLSPAVIPDDDMRAELGRELARGPLGPAIWKVREIEWAVATPPVVAGPPVGIAALDYWRATNKLVDDLCSLPDRHQAARDDPRWARPEVVHVLLFRRRALVFSDPRLALDRARLATTTAQQTMCGAGDRWRPHRGLMALALASEANTHRILGDTLEARRLLSTAKLYIRGETNLRMRGQYLCQVGSTLAHLTERDQANLAVEQAIGIFRKLNDWHVVAKLMVLKSLIEFAGGTLTNESLHQLKRAAKLADSNREPWLQGNILLNLARYQADLGLVGEAEATWREIKPFDDCIPEIRRRGILGVILLAAERWEDAHDELSATAEAFSRVGHTDAAYYQLLCVVALLGNGRLTEANRLGLQLAEYLAGSQIEEVAIVASQAAEQARSGNLTAAITRQLARKVETAPPVGRAVPTNPIR